MEGSGGGPGGGCLNKSDRRLKPLDPKDDLRFRKGAFERGFSTFRKGRGFKREGGEGEKGFEGGRRASETGDFEGRFRNPPSWHFLSPRR